MKSAKAAKIAFWSWVAVSTLAWIVGLADGSLFARMLLAVDYAAAAGSTMEGFERDQSAWILIAMSAAYFVASVAVGGWLIYKSAQRRRWALGLLIPLGIWWCYEAASFPFSMRKMYPAMTVEVWDWMLAAFGALVWVSVLILLTMNYFVSKGSNQAINSDAAQ